MHNKETFQPHAQVSFPAVIAQNIQFKGCGPEILASLQTSACNFLEW